PGTAATHLAATLLAATLWRLHFGGPAFAPGLPAGAGGCMTVARRLRQKGGTRSDSPGIFPMQSTRKLWIDLARKLAVPVLSAAARCELRARLPVEEPPGAGRGAAAALEAVARLLTGMAPWLESDDEAVGDLAGL